MSAFAAQIEKDTRLLWPLVAIWIVGLGLSAVISQGMLGTFGSNLAMYSGYLFELFVVLITAMLVLQEPLGDTDAFWITKPIPVGSLLSSKATLLAAFVVLPGLALQAVAYLRLDLQAPGLGPVLLQTALWIVSMVAFAWLLASVSRSLPVFITWLAGFLLVGNVAEIAVLAGLESMLAPLIGATGRWLGWLGIVLVLVAVALRYGRGWFPMFIVLAVIGLMSMRAGLNQEIPDSSHLATRYTGEFALKTNTTGHPIQADFLTIDAWLEVPVAEGAYPEMYRATSRLEFPDGTVILGDQARVIDTHPQLRDHGERLGDAIHPRARAPDYEIQNLLAIPATELTRLSGMEGELTVRLSGRWIAPRIVDLPARVGQSWNTAFGRSTLSEFRLEPRQLVLVIQHVSIGQVPSESIEPFLYHPQRQEILWSSSASRSGLDERSRPLVISHPISQIGTEVFTQRFDARDESFDAGGGYRYVTRIDRKWLEGARIRIETADKLGPINETIRIAHFRVPDWH